MSYVSPKILEMDGQNNIVMDLVLYLFLHLISVISCGPLPSHAHYFETLFIFLLCLWKSVLLLGLFFTIYLDTKVMRLM
jgi:hypothetical protein